MYESLKYKYTHSYYWYQRTTDARNDGIYMRSSGGVQPPALLRSTSIIPGNGTIDAWNGFGFAIVDPVGKSNTELPCVPMASNIWWLWTVCNGIHAHYTNKWAGGGCQGQGERASHWICESDAARHLVVISTLPDDASLPCGCHPHVPNWIHYYIRQHQDCSNRLTLILKA